MNGIECERDRKKELHAYRLNCKKTCLVLDEAKISVKNAGFNCRKGIYTI